MAVAIHVYISDKDGNFSGVEHVFYAETEEQADKIRLAHLAGCENYGRAEATERAFETIEEIDEADIPTPEVYEQGEEGDDEEEEAEEEAAGE